MCGKGSPNWVYIAIVMGDVFPLTVESKAALGVSTMYIACYRGEAVPIMTSGVR